MAVSVPDADELIAQAGLDASNGGWLLPDGTRTSDHATALAGALAAISDRYRTGRSLELDAEVAESVRVGLASILAGSPLSYQEERAAALLQAVGGGRNAAVVVDLTQHRTTLLAALHARIEMCGRSPEDETLIGTLSEVQLKVDRRGLSSDWLEGEGEW